MARDESDREDLLREATALVVRIEFAPASNAGEGPSREHVVVGFRVNGALSVFFGADPVYQFNSAGELRRAFASDLLYKAERGRLVSLQRVRTPTEVQLVRTALSPPEERAFLFAMRGRLEQLAADLSAGVLTIVGQVPQDQNVLGCVIAWLAKNDGSRIATSPGS